MKKVNFQSRNGQNITISAVINFPEGFDEGKKFSAVVMAHPGGGVKEQTAGLYARKLAENGFVTIAFDASYQGESTGEPRQLEDPYIRTEDISAVIDYLTTFRTWIPTGSEAWASVPAAAIPPIRRSTTVASRRSERSVP
jgi:fermentation-respiration switch protein FrsA (DUF1100 family)